MSALRQPADRLPHGPPGQLGAALPQPDCLLPAAVPWEAGRPRWLLPGTQALPRLLGLRVCAAPCDGLVVPPVAGPWSERWSWVYNHLPRFPSSCFPSWAGGSGGLCLVGPVEMLSAWDRRDRPPEEGAAAGLQGFSVDKTFLSSLKGILLETELALTFIIFICFTASISAYMAAALLEFFITLAFLFLYATQYYQRFDRLNWPCLDFLRCVSAIIIFLVVSFAAVTSRDGAAIAAFVFGIILVSVFAYDAFKIYRTEIVPRATQADQQ
uniref:CKLF like MARVEL transmembrane domain containing 5 n=2 Tax=Equus TaxID=9789 RepID=A0A8C4LWR9_EQUAS|nr:CKLF-like MARVEL transmembrane domain-containing protein 5 [Equus asinus]